mgnify:CR=1 FL=1
MAEENDSVKNPPHYTQGNIEAKDFIVDQKMTWAIGNAVKYLVRYRYKNSNQGEGQITDLRKAIENIQIQIDSMLDKDIK